MRQPSRRERVLRADERVRDTSTPTVRSSTKTPRQEPLCIRRGTSADSSSVVTTLVSVGPMRPASLALWSVFSWCPPLLSAAQGTSILSFFNFKSHVPIRPLVSSLPPTLHLISLLPSIYSASIATGNSLSLSMTLNMTLLIQPDCSGSLKFRVHCDFAQCHSFNVSSTSPPVFAPFRRGLPFTCKNELSTHF